MVKIENLKLGYNNNIIVKNFNATINKGEVVTIIGPNGCGKSTVLKGVSRLIKTYGGKIFVDGKSICSMDCKGIARVMATVSQYNSCPEDLTVEKLVSFGRSPHKKWYESLNDDDKKIISWAMKCTNIEKFKEKRVSSLSGGERQRAWIAMALAQKPKVLLLDEPTTYLDVSNQLEILELVKTLNKNTGLTVVMVLHDLNQAAKYSNRIIVMNNGILEDEGLPKKVLNKSLIKKVYKVEMDILEDINGEEMVFIPKAVC